MKWERWEMIEKSIKKIVHRMREACIDAKSADSSFSTLTKFCQRIRSISTRKDQISSALFVLLDRLLALQDRDVIWLHSTLLRSDTIWHQVLYVTDSTRSLETILIWLLDVLVTVKYALSKRYYLTSNRDVLTVRFFETVLFDMTSSRCSRLTKDTSL